MIKFDIINEIVLYYQSCRFLVLNFSDLNKPALWVIKKTAKASSD